MKKEGSYELLEAVKLPILHNIQLTPVLTFVNHIFTSVYNSFIHGINDDAHVIVIKAHEHKRLGEACADPVNSFNTIYIITSP